MTQTTARRLSGYEVYEVFAQAPGRIHVHVGSVLAPDRELALLLAKENHTRRGEVASLWVVRRADIAATAPADREMLQTRLEKSYRQPEYYRSTRQKWQRFKTPAAARGNGPAGTAEGGDAT